MTHEPNRILFQTNPGIETVKTVGEFVLRFFPSSSLRTGIVIQKQFVCSTARKYQPENVNGARTRRLKNPQDPAFAINFS